MRFLIAILLTSSAAAECRWAWVDHDYNVGTPAVYKQICSSTLDVPAVRSPSVRPIQSPQVKPLRSLRLPPLGTRRCETRSVFERGRWVDRDLCY